MSKQLAVDDRSMSLARKRKLINFGRAMLRVFKRPKAIDLSRLEAESRKKEEELMASITELAEMKASMRLDAEVKELRDENRKLNAILAVTMSDRC